MRGKQQVRLLENNLTSIKQQIKIARSEIKKCKNYEDKEMYLKLKNANDLMGKETKNMSEGEDTDRSSEFSCGSLSSRSIGLDTSLDSNVASRENSSTPKPRINKM